VVYFNVGESARAAENLRKAYEFRERLSEREKLYITAHYHDMVTGNLEAARKDYELWAQIYPRDPIPTGNLGIIYLLLGQFDEALALAEKDAGLLWNKSNSNLAAAYLYVNQLDRAKATAREGIRVQDSPLYHTILYSVAFLQHDQSEMDKESTVLSAKPGSDEVILYKQANTAAYGGQFAKARVLAKRAIESAEQADEKQSAAEYEAVAALHEAIVGNVALAKQEAQAALALSSGREVEAISAIALGMTGDSAQAQRLAGALDKTYPENTIMHLNFLPTIHAAVDIRTGNAHKAIEYLAPATPYELGYTDLGTGFCLYPVYLRGEAYLAAKQGPAAASEFQKILDHPGVVQNEPIGALAHLGLGQAYALWADKSKAHAAYQDFFALWKNADPDIPSLKQAKAEYTKLQ
jgi:eukaryotic-like serine/threonine-protein kinase